MLTGSAYKDFTQVARASEPVAWVETILLTALAVGLGIYFVPEDPLQVYEFPWPLLAPLLVGLRYGFFKALVSAGLLIAAVLLLRESGLPVYERMPSTWIIGMLVTSLVVGEFRDLWGRRLQRLQMANEYRQYRLDEFTRAHQILRLSHDRLELRVAGSDQSLRSSLLILRERLRELKPKGDPLIAMAQPIIELLGQYGSLGIAGLYAVKDGRMESRPLATLGAMGALEPGDKMVCLCLEKGDLVSIREEFLERGDQKQFSSLQVCVPLIDTEHQILGILAVRQMPFFVFNDRTFSLLALLAGHVADLLRSDAAALQLHDADAQSFSQQLRRALVDVEQHNADAALCLFELPDSNQELLRLFADSQRGLDVQIHLRNSRGFACILVLLPLTSTEGYRGYLTRLHYQLAERFGQERTLDDVGVRVMFFQMDPSGRREGLRNFLYHECGLNDQQVAI
ncbi:MAG: PelD GGDEF domain-containing protein [Halopseudomonas sp.]